MTLHPIFKRIFESHLGVTFDEDAIEYRDHVISRSHGIMMHPSLDFCYEHKDFDGPPDDRGGYGESVEACKAAIDAWWDEQEEDT